MNLLEISSKYLTLEPNRLLQANKVYEYVINMYEDSDDGIEYIKENLSGKYLEYALELLEAQSSYMGTPIYFQNGKFSAPRLALYGYESRPLLKTKIREKISKSNDQEKKSKELRKTRKEEFEQLDEISPDLALRASKAADIKRGELARAGDKEGASAKAAQAKRLYDKQAAKRLNREEVELDEKIDVGADAGATISDFVHSKSATFKGDSKKERIRRALGAYYGAKNEAKNEEGKEQGVDGKACWKGYKYAGTENGKDKCVKEDSLDEVYGRYGRRQTASGRYVPRDEPDEDEQLRQSDAIQAKLRAQKAKQQASAGKERLKAKGAVPTRNGKPVFEGVEIDENLELFVQYSFDSGIVESIDEMNELLTVISEEDYNYIVNEAMGVAPAPNNQQQKPQPQANQQQKPQPQTTTAPAPNTPTKPNPQQAQQNSPTPQQNTQNTQQQKPQPNQQKKPVTATEETEHLETKKKDGVVINPKMDQDMTAGEKTSAKVSKKLKEEFSLNIDKDLVISKFFTIK